MKYVRLMDDTVITGPNEKEHEELADGAKVKSAGHYRIDSGVVKTFGKSFGFNVYPRSGDAKLITDSIKNK